MSSIMCSNIYKKICDREKNRCVFVYLFKRFFPLYEVSSNLARILLFFNGFRHVYTILCLFIFVIVAQTSLSSELLTF